MILVYENDRRADAVTLLFDDIVKIEKFNPYHGKDGRFASADGAASFTYAPGKSVAHDKAIAREKDRTMRKEFGDKINGMADTLHMRDPKNCIEVGKEVSKEIDRRFKIKKKAGETEFEEPQTEDIYDVLKDIREFGPGEYAHKITVDSHIDDSRTQEIMDDALNRFPKDWYKGAYKECIVQIHDREGRGMFGNGYGKEDLIKVYARESKKNVKELELDSDFIPNKGISNQLAHELGHFFESNVWEVQEAARTYYDKRTKNCEITEMRPGEYTKADRFASEYMGRVYPNSSMTEITSVLSQKLGYYNPKQSITSDILGVGRKDMQSYNFILGLMAAGGRTT